MAQIKPITISTTINSINVKPSFSLNFDNILILPGFYNKKQSIQQRGFTAVEVIVALSLIAIIATLSLPSIQAYTISNRVKSVAEVLYSNIQILQAEAIKNNQTLTLAWQTGSNWCYGLTDKSNCNCNTTNDCTLSSITTVVLPTNENVQISTTGFSTTNVQFEGVRGMPTSYGSWIISRGTYSIQITMNKIGRLSMCSTNIGGYTAC